MNGRAHPALTVTDRAALRRDGDFVGGLLIVTVICLTFLFDAVLQVLRLSGVLSAEALLKSDLGLGNVGYMALYAAMYLFSMGLPTLVCCLLFHRSLRGMMSVRPVRADTLVTTVLSGMGGCMLASVVCSLIKIFLENSGISQPAVPTYLDGTLPTLLVGLVVWAALPALLEELMFRVCILGSLRKYGDWFAIVVSAVLFGCIHGSITQIAFATAVGFVFGYITVSLGNVWLAVGLHFVNNALSVCLQHFTMGMPQQEAARVTTAVLLSVVCVGIFAAWLSKRMRTPLFRRLMPMNRPAGACFATMFTSPSMLIGAALMALRIVLAFLL